jgi:hypothetical protein
MGQNSFQFASREIWFAYANFSDSTVRLREIWFACANFPDSTVPLREIWFACARSHANFPDSPLKDEKTAFSAFLLFQATFHSKSFAPQI